MAERLTLPVLPLREVVLFPGVTAVGLVLLSVAAFAFRRRATHERRPPWLVASRIVLSLVTATSAVAILIALFIGPWSATVGGVLVRMTNLNRALALVFLSGVSLALTDDFVNFERCGLVMQPDDKDAAMLPRRIDGMFALVHRPIADSGAHVWISYSPDLRSWGGHRMMLQARRGGWWDANKVGLSPPLIETERGWLMLYHGVRSNAAGSLDAQTSTDRLRHKFNGVGSGAAGRMETVEVLT